MSLDDRIVRRGNNRTRINQGFIVEGIMLKLITVVINDIKGFVYNKLKLSL